MPILPLPVFEADMKAAQADAEAYAKLKAPTSIVVRFGVMKLVGEYPYSGDAKPGCGSKLVVHTHRGLELAEMLTSTCPNAGCSKSVTRQEMLEYIENSGGKEYPFFDQGRIVRLATTDDLNEQRRLDSLKPAMKKTAQAICERLSLNMKIIEAEPIIGGERLTVYFTSEDRIDFRELVSELAREYQCRIEMRQVGARDEARLVADYERCGQHCCCKQFLKVLKPISMKAAKTQKATLDPLKISGRCGRLMCCLRYEDQTYTELDKRLPRLKAKVGTPEGPGIVVDRQILTQLVLVSLDADDNKRIAVAVEDLVSPEESIEALAKKQEIKMDALRGFTPDQAARRGGAPAGDRAQQQERQRDRVQRDDRAPRPAAPGAPGTPGARDNRPARPSRPPQPPRTTDAPPGNSAAPRSLEPPAFTVGPDGTIIPAEDGAGGEVRRKRRRRRGRGGAREGEPGAPRPDAPPGEAGAPQRQREPMPPREPRAEGSEPAPGEDGPDGPRRRRRRRRRGGGGGGGGGQGRPGGPSGGGAPGSPPAA